MSTSPSADQQLQVSSQREVPLATPTLPPVTMPCITFNVAPHSSQPHSLSTQNFPSSSQTPLAPPPTALQPNASLNSSASSSVQFSQQTQTPFLSNIPYVPDGCSLCGSELVPEMTVRLGCQHCLCFPCMIDHQAATKYNTTTNCPDPNCNIPIARYQYSKHVWLGKTDRSRQKKMELVVQPSREYPHCNPAQKLVTVQEGVDEIRKYVSQATPESIGSQGVLCTSQVKVLAKDGKVRVKPVAFSALSLNPKDPPNYDVTQHFVAFHPILRAVSSTSAFETTPLSVDQLLEFIPTDPRLMVRVVLALATGHSSATDFDVHNAYGQSYLLASYLACDLIQRCINPQKEMGPAIRTLTAATDAEASVALRLLLSKFRVTQSCKNYYRNKQSKENHTNDEEHAV